MSLGSGLKKIKDKLTSKPAIAVMGGIVGAGLYNTASNMINKRKAMNSTVDYLVRVKGMDPIVAQEIASSVRGLAPGMFDDGDMGGAISSAVSQSGGISYPVAMSLIEANNNYEQQRDINPDIPGLSFNYLEDNRLSRKDYKRLSSKMQDVGWIPKTSSPNWLKVITPGLVGGGAVIAGLAATHAISGALSKMSLNESWNNLIDRYSDRVAAIGADEAMRQLKILHKMSPVMASNPDVAINYIQHMVMQGGPDIHTVAELSKLKRKSGGGIGVSGVMSAANAVGGYLL